MQNLCHINAAFLVAAQKPIEKFKVDKNYVAAQNEILLKIVSPEVSFFCFPDQLVTVYETRIHYN